MGTTAEKLQKLVDNKQLIIDKVNNKAGTSFDINSKPSDVANAIENIESGIDTSDATANASDILQGKTAYTSEGKVEGTIETYNGAMTEGAEQISTGLPIEVDSLPIKEGTAVPSSGMVEKLYFNTALSDEEVVNILSKLTYIQTPLFAHPLCGILFSNDGNPIVIAGTIGEGDDIGYYITIITDMNNMEYVNAFDYNNVVEDGWKLNEYIINKEVISEYQGLPIGTQNELIKNLVSATPFESDGVEDAIYKTPRKFSDLYLYANESYYGKLSAMYSLLGSEEVETKPTSNIISSTTESFYLYYVKSEKDIFVYIDIGYGDMWVSTSVLIEQVLGESLSFQGEYEEGDELTNVGYYAYFVPEYLYQVKDSQLQELKYKPKKIEISPGSYEETIVPLKGEYFSEVKLTAGNYITPNAINRLYTILGVKGTCIPVEDFFHNMSFDKIEMNGVILKENMFYQKRVNEIEIKSEAYYGGTSYCPLPPSVFAFCEATKIVLRGDYILKPDWLTKQGYDKDGNLVTIYNKFHAFIGCSNLTTLVLDFPDFAPISLTNYADFAVDLFKNTPIANGTGYIYVPDNKVDYVKTLVGYNQVASRIRPLSEYTE